MMQKWKNVKGKSVITAEYAQCLFEIGKELVKNGTADNGEIYDKFRPTHSVVSAIQGGIEYEKKRWNTDFDTTEKIWYRIGDVKYDYNWEDFCPSYNYRDDCSEMGVSVIDKDWLSSVSAQFFDTSAGIYELIGIQVAWGSDGEPVVIPTSIPKYVGKDFKNLI